ncbi:DUF1853 family protein, partial [Undibacterium luofuense]|uniref:DUF1853 family protein n=1 Tax=Undibacterium luofuense TaxID=2828733 RepID=UPI0030EDB3BB
ALFASVCVRTLFGNVGRLGATIPHGTPLQSLGLETILTFILFLVILRVSTGAREKGITAGEFDFLLTTNDGYRHVELATKFYLCRQHQPDAGLMQFLGPNLADALGLKIPKMLRQQMQLGQTALAQSVLDQPVLSASAMIKGWLFYRSHNADVHTPGLHPQHARGLILTTDELAALQEPACLLPKMAWLAPAICPESEVRAAAECLPLLQAEWQKQEAPYMLATLKQQDGQWLESGRAMVIPDNWAEKAIAAELTLQRQSELTG